MKLQSTLVCHMKHIFAMFLRLQGIPPTQLNMNFTFLHSIVGPEIVINSATLSSPFLASP